MNKFLVGACAVGLCVFLVSTAHSEPELTPVAKADVQVVSTPANWVELPAEQTEPNLEVNYSDADGFIAASFPDKRKKKKKKGYWCKFTDGSKGCYCSNPNAGRPGGWMCFWKRPRGKCKPCRRVNY